MKFKFKKKMEKITTTKPSYEYVRLFLGFQKYKINEPNQV